MTNQFQEALQEYQRAVDLDPHFGRAYAGMAVVYANYLKQPDKAEASYKAALNHLDRMTEREKYRTLGTYYLTSRGTTRRPSRTTRALVKAVPRRRRRPREPGARLPVMADVPRAVVGRAKRASRFIRRIRSCATTTRCTRCTPGISTTAIAEASRLLKENPKFEYAYAAVRVSASSRRATRRRHGPHTPACAGERVRRLLRQAGRRRSGDVFRPASSSAVRVLREGIALDDENKSTAEGVPQKYVALAEAYLALGQRGRGRRRGGARPPGVSRDESSLFPAARVLLRAGQEEQALQVAADLENMLQSQTTAYARADQRRDCARARPTGRGYRAAFRAAQKRHNSWFGRFLLGKAYVEAGHLPRRWRSWSSA